MATYTKTTDFLAKDSLPLNNSAKYVKGSEIDAEFDNLTTADADNMKKSVMGTGIETFLQTPSSANLASAITNETGTGSLVFGTSPTLTTPTVVGGSYVGAQALGDNNLTGIKTASFTAEANLATTTGAVTVDWTAAQNYKQTEPTGAITYTFTAPPGVCHLQLRIISDGTSTAYTHVFPASVKWLNTIWAQVTNKNAVINFWYDGTNYWAMGANEV